MIEDYSISILRRKQQILSMDMQLQGIGPYDLFDPRRLYLASLDNALLLLEENKRKIEKTMKGEMNEKRTTEKL